MNQFGGDGLIIAAATAGRVQPWSMYDTSNRTAAVTPSSPSQRKPCSLRSGVGGQAVWDPVSDRLPILFGAAGPARPSGPLAVSSSAPTEAQGEALV